MADSPKQQPSNAASPSGTGDRDAADITRGRNEHERSAGQQGGSRTAQGVPQQNATRQSPPVKR